jgi:integrase
VQQALAGIRRTHGVRPQRRVAPVVKDTLVGQCSLSASRLQKPLAFARDKAVLLLSFCGALRRSEACALEVADLKFLDGGMDVLIRRSKTDAERSRADHFCAESERHAMRSGRSLGSGWNWRRSPRDQCSGRCRAATACYPGALSPQSVALIVKRAAARIGANADEFQRSLAQGWLLHRGCNGWPCKLADKGRDSPCKRRAPCEPTSDLYQTKRQAYCDILVLRTL